MQEGVHTARPSWASLPIWPKFHGHTVGTDPCATGFVALRPNDDRRWLVTNWHVVTSKSPDTGQPLNKVTGFVPDELLIAHHFQDHPGAWVPVTEPLYDADGDPLWYEHPTHGRRVDVVALPITRTTAARGEQIETYGHDPWREDTLETLEGELPVDMGRPLSVIGFPFGNTGGGWLPIWIQGWVASEPAIDLHGLPLFLIDARTRPGQSGSPVIAYSPGPPTSLIGAVSMSAAPVERFVGVYSGRLNDQSDIGRVWKRRALVEVIDGAQRGPLP